MIVTGKPVARVNGTVLTDRDLQREMFAIFPYARQHNGSVPQEMEPQIRQGAMQMIIFEELVYQEAQRRKITVSAERLNRAEADFRKQFSSPAEYKSFVQSEFNGSERQLREKIRRSLMIEALLEERRGQQVHGYGRRGQSLLRQESGDFSVSGILCHPDDLDSSSARTPRPPS